MSSLSTSPLGQALSPLAGEVEVAGVFIAHSPQESWAMGCVSVVERPLMQFLVCKPAALQVAGLSTTQLPHRMHSAGTGTELEDGTELEEGSASTAAGRAGKS